MKQEIEELETLIDKLCRRNDDLLRQKDECARRLSTIEENANRKVDECLQGIQKSELTLRSVKKQLDAVRSMVADLSAAVEREIGNLESARNRALPLQSSSSSQSASAGPVAAPAPSESPKSPAGIAPAPQIGAAPAASSASASSSQSVGGIIGLAPNQGGVFVKTVQTPARESSDSSPDKK